MARIQASRKLLNPPQSQAPPHPFQPVAFALHPDAKRQILFSLIASKENASKYGTACGAIFNSIGAVSSDDQAPADWMMKKTDEGVYVESPDQLVAMNVIMVDKADVEDAEEVLKKNVGGTIQGDSLEWRKCARSE